MRKILHTTFILALLFFSLKSNAQITLGTVDAGPYTPGSTIAATFTTAASSCIQIGNKFDLYLSDASGSFSSPTLLGSYDGFYATFINGTVPAGTPAGTGYRLRVVSTTPAMTSADSNPFEIKGGTAVTAKINSTAINSANPEVFGYCAYRANATLNITNQSTATGSVTATITNELVPSTPVTNITFDTNIKPFSPGAAHYTVLVKVIMPDGTKATKAYFIINNQVNNAFSTSGAGVVCLPLGEFIYGVDTQTENGIQKNFPGNTYRITWGDDKESAYTLCQLQQSENIRHTYTESSCGRNANGKFNVYGIVIGARSPFCGEIGQSLSATAKVVTVTKNRFSSPPLGCTNTDITFSNTSVAGQSQDDNSPDCTDQNVTYNWYVNGQIKLSNVPKTTDFVYNFPTSLVYEIKLESISSGECQGAPVTTTICIQAPPQPSFTLSANPLITCAPGIVKPVNTSVIDATCDPTVNYRWTITGGTVSYDDGTSAASKEPIFRFTTPGVYKIKLAVSTGTCGEFSTAEQTIIIDGTPTAVLSPDIKLCNLSSYDFNNTTTGPTKTTFTGSFTDEDGKYLWTVTGGQFAFTGGTTANSQYPKIEFREFAEYTVTVTHTNACGPVSDAQIITFATAPTVNAGDDQAICFNDAVSLAGTISAPVTSYKWVGGTGVFSDRNVLNPTYTPSAAERNAHTVTLILQAVTELADPCNVINNDIIITIQPQIIVTSAATATRCTGVALNYQPTATPANTTFSWTAAGTANAGGYAPTGTTFPIADVLTNSDPINNATVTYTITPVNNGCTGVPFTLRVTVTPRPVITATAANPAICTGSAAGITITSNLPNTKFTWTAAVVGGITGANNITIPRAATGITDLLSNAGTAQGSVTYTITPYSANSCAGDPFNITILVDPAVTTATAGADESICDVDNYQLDGNQPTVGTGIWALTSGQTGVGFGSATDPKTTITGLVAGQAYTFRWTISSPGACAASSDEVTITVNTPTIAGTTSGEATVCFENNTGVVTLNGYTGSIEGWESSTDNGVTWIPAAVPNTTATLTYTNLTQSTGYRAIVKNGGCEIKYSTSTLITVTPATTIATAGADQTLCNELSTMLDGNEPSTATGETGRWTLVSGNPNAVITDATLRNTTVTNLVAGITYVFRWTITGTSACGPTADEVTINNQSPLTNTISSTDAEVCNGKVVTLTGSIPTGGAGADTYTYVWESSTDGTTFTTINGETGKDLSVTLTSTLTFRRTVSSGACTMASNVIRIIAQPPLANNTIAADQELCTGFTPAGLTGSTPTGSDGNYNYQWQSSPDGTAWTDINAAVLPNYAPPALTATTFYRRIVSTITCDGALRNISAAIKITVKENAKAEYTFTTDKGCMPFVLDAQNIQVVLYPDRNATYTWYADDVVIGTSSSFPGYTITESNRSVTIKLITTSSLGCSEATYSHAFSTAQNVTPAFTQSTTSGCGPLVVNFVNTSTSLTTGTFTWDFGNGQTSAQTMPSAVTFLPEATGKDTTYTITLTSITSCGTTSVTSTVFVKAQPIAVFSPSRTTGCSPMRVTFTNTSPGSTNKYYYDFGDGTLLTANDRSDVEHTYITNVVRDYVVTMVAENECGRDEKSYTIRVSPNTVLPELVVNANEKEGCAPFSVNFYNNSKGANVFVYDFGDGARLTTRSAPEMVTHTFTRSGTFTVTLTASNGCSDTTTTETITVFAQPVVAFNADVKLGCAGLAVKFTNTSTDALTYVWDFGDGTTSAEFEPLHTYTAAQEFYTVSLTATNSLGCSQTTTMTNFIHIVQPPIAVFHVAPSNVISIPTYNFRFEDESSNNPAIWAWDFGDGTTSTLQNPSHSYLDTGTYVVTLRVTNTQGCSSSTFQNVTITGVPGYLYIANSFIPGSEYLELRDFRAKGSGIKSWRMSIFNKWGQALWETTKLEDGSPAEGWDGTFNGTPQPQGVYFWKIDVEFINGSAWKGMTYDKSAPKKTGAIHLIR